MKEWDVYLYNDLIDTIWYIDCLDELDIRKELIEHDGYDLDIEVYCVSEKEKDNV